MAKRTPHRTASLTGYLKRAPNRSKIDFICYFEGNCGYLETGGLTTTHRLMVNRSWCRCNDRMLRGEDPSAPHSSCVSIRQTTSLVVRGLGRAFLCLSVCLSPPPSPSRVPVFLAHLLPFDSSPHRKLLLPRGVQARDARVCPDAHIGVQRHVAIVSLAFRCLHRDSERRCMACEMR